MWLAGALRSPSPDMAVPSPQGWAGGGQATGEAAGGQPATAAALPPLPSAANSGPVSRDVGALPPGTAGGGPGPIHPAMPETNATPPSTPPLYDSGSISPIDEADWTPVICAMDNATDAPVRYFDGTVLLTDSDLTSDGFGASWGQTRSWSNSPGYAPIDLGTNRPRGFNGSGMIDVQLPYVLANNNFNTAIVVTSGTNALFFDRA